MKNLTMLFSVLLISSMIACGTHKKPDAGDNTSTEQQPDHSAVMDNKTKADTDSSKNMGTQPADSLH